MEQTQSPTDISVDGAVQPPLVQTKQNNFTLWRYFLVEQISVDAESQDNNGTTRRLVFADRVDCDKALLASFFPIGRVPRVVLPCSETSSSNGGSEKQVSYDLTISYEGLSTVETPAGKFKVQHIRLEHATNENKFEISYLFSEQYGIPIVSETKSASNDGKATNVYRTEVVSITK